MPVTDTPQVLLAVSQSTAGAGVRRALRRAWREALVPIGAGDTAAIGPLRAVVRAVLTGWGVSPTRIDDVELIASELTTNAVLHTCGPVRVRLAYRQGALRLDVADTSRHGAKPGGPDLDAECPHGWGLGIAAALADHVETVIGPHGKTVTAIVLVEARTVEEPGRDRAADQ